MLTLVRSLPVHGPEALVGFRHACTSPEAVRLAMEVRYFNHRPRQRKWFPDDDTYALYRQRLSANKTAARRRPIFTVPALSGWTAGSLVALVDAMFAALPTNPRDYIDEFVRRSATIRGDRVSVSVRRHRYGGESVLVWNGDDFRGEVSLPGPVPARALAALLRRYADVAIDMCLTADDFGRRA